MLYLALQTDAFGLRQAYFGVNVVVIDILFFNTSKVHWSPLHLAADGGHHEVVALLLARGAVVDALDEWVSLLCVA